MIDFSIIIPTYKDWGRLSLCIDRLLNQKVEGVHFEIIAVDNEPEHAPPAFFLSKYVHNNVSLIHETSPGSYAARNRGAKLAKGTYLAFTDADCLPDNRWLNNAKNRFDEEDCDLIGGKIDIFKPDEGGEWAFIYEKHMSFRQHIHVKKGRSVTANLLVKRRVFESLKGFDSDVKSGGDWEFTERAVSKGFKMVYGDGVVVKHPARKSVKEIMKKQKRFAAWGYLNVKNRYEHSGLRIIGSSLLRGTPASFKSASYPEKLNEKLIVLLISLQIHAYKMTLQILFLLRIRDPEKIRE